MAFHEWINAENKGTSCLSEQDFANLSQRELANRIGIAQSTIARMEKNMHSMSVGNFCKLLSSLGYKLDIVKKEEENE